MKYGYNRDLGTVLHLQQEPYYSHFTTHSYCIGSKLLNSYCMWRSWPACMLALTRTSMNLPFKHRKGNHVHFPNWVTYFILVLFIGQASLSHGEKKVSYVHKFCGGKNPLSIKAGSYLGESSSPWTQGSSEQWFSAPGGRYPTPPPPAHLSASASILEV